MPFRVKTRVGLRNFVRGGADPTRGRSNFRGLSGPFRSIGNLRHCVRCHICYKRDYSVANKHDAAEEIIQYSDNFWVQMITGWHSGYEV